MKEFKRDREKWRKDLFGNQGLSSADRCASPLFASGGGQQPMLTIERILTGPKNEEASKKEMTIQKLTDWMEMRRKSIVSVSALKFN